MGVPKRYSHCAREPQEVVVRPDSVLRGEVLHALATCKQDRRDADFLASIDCGPFLTPAHKPAEPLVKLLRNRVD